MRADKYTKEISHCFSDSSGSSIYIDYHFHAEEGDIGLSMVGLEEDYCGELTVGSSFELHAVFGEDALDFARNMLSEEAEMMFTLEDLICEIDGTQKGSRVARALRKALKQHETKLDSEARRRTELIQEQARENARRTLEWNELESVKFLRSADYPLPHSPDELTYKKQRIISENKLTPGIDKAIGENNISALKALLEIGRDDELLGVYAFEVAGKASNLDAVRELVAFYGHDGDMRKNYIWYNGVAVSQPFKILFEEGFEEGAIFILEKSPEIENRSTSKQVNSGQASLDGLTIANWIHKAGDQGFDVLEKALRDFSKESQPS